MWWIAVVWAGLCMPWHAQGLSDGFYTVMLQDFGAEKMKHMARTSASILHLERRGGKWKGDALMTTPAIGAQIQANTVTLYSSSESGSAVQVALGVCTNPFFNVVEPNLNVTVEFTVPPKALNVTWHCQQSFGTYKAVCAESGEGHCDGTANGTVCNAFYWPVYEPVTVVPGFVPVQPNEHPRLAFRKADVPRLRKLYTSNPIAQGIVKRLEQQLAYVNWTAWSAAGYCFLWQIKQESTYLDQGKAALDKYFAGDLTIDMTPESKDYLYAYSHFEAWNTMRVSPSLLGAAFAYDMCYEGWPASYRTTVVQNLQMPSFPCGTKQWDDHNHVNVTMPPCGTTKGVDDNHRDVLLYLACWLPWCNHQQDMVYSNHFGLWHGAAAALALTIQGDDGVNMTTINRVGPLMHLFTKKFLREAYGNRGWMSECDGEDRMGPNAGMNEWVVASRNVMGIDPTATLENAQWMLSKYVFFLHQNAKYDKGTWTWASGNCDGGCLRGHYTHGGMVTPEGRYALSHGGDFAGGFGLLAPFPKLQAAALWSLNHTVSPLSGSDPVYQGVPPADYDVYTLGHRGAQAFANWPYDVAEANPAGVLGHTMHDTTFQMLAWRNRWDNHQDTVISWLLVKPQSPDMTHGHYCEAGLRIQSLGAMPPLNFPNKIKHQPPHSLIFNNSQLIRQPKEGGGAAAEWLSTLPDGTSTLLLTWFDSFVPVADRNVTGVMAVAVDVTALSDTVQAVVAIANGSAVVPPATEKQGWIEWKLNSTRGEPPCLGTNNLTIAQEWHNGYVTNGRALALWMSCCGKCPQPATTAAGVVVGSRTYTYKGRGLTIAHK